MDTYENEIETVTQTEKVSPFADSPYECLYTQTQPETAEQPEQTDPVEEPKPAKPVKAKRRGRPLLVLLLLICACVVTAAGVSYVWEQRITRMEQAMNEKFTALEQMYSQQQNQPNTPSQTPVTGPMTPGQVYAKNVDAVVAINTQIQSGGQYGEGAGSGFIISADGYVVTNYHVIEDATKITVLPHNGKEMTAKVVGSDSANDVALLKVEATDLPFVTFGSSDALQVGDQVAAIGNPLGELTATLTVGYVSAKDRIVNTDGTVINMLQTDAAINSGNSGGPLFDMNGNVVGITTAKYSGNSNSGATIEGIGFAVPIDDVTGILSDLKEFGYVTGAYLGVYVRDVDASAQSYGLPAGAYIEEAIKGYCAQKAGIRTGDIIVNLGGYDVDSVTTLTRVLRRFKAGESVSVTVYRAGKQEYLTVKLDEKPAQTQQTQPQETKPSNNQNGSGNPFYDFFAPYF